MEKNAEIDTNLLTMSQQSKRIDWIDIYRAIAIVLMVVGHATGKFNGYIYQFHMAAFFFISGYVSNLEKKSFGETLCNKFFTLLLPLITFIISGSILLKILSHFTDLTKLFDIPFLGIKGTFFTWLKTGDLYIQFLGATWFLVILFGIFILQKLLLLLMKNKIGFPHFIISSIIYLIGRYMINHNMHMI